MLVSVIVMIALAGFFSWAICRAFSNVQMINKVSVGIVLPENDSQTETILRMVSAMDSAESICTFEYVTEEEMYEGIKSGKYFAGTKLTEDFYNDVNYGTNTPLTVYFSKNMDVAGFTFKELLYDALNYSQITESAIYSVVDLRFDYPLAESIRDTEETLTQFYILGILGRGAAFNNIVLSATGEVNLYQYYVVAGVILFLLLGAMLFGYLYREEENSLIKVLRLQGITSAWVSFVRLLILAFYTYISLVVSYIIGNAICNKLEIDLFDHYVGAYFALIPLAFGMAGVAHLLYSVAKSKTIGMILVALVNLIMVICAGGIMPNAYIPKLLQWIGQILPLRFWLDALGRIYFGKGVGIAILIEIIMALVCYVISTLVTEHKK